MNGQIFLKENKNIIDMSKKIQFVALRNEELSSNLLNWKHGVVLSSIVDDESGLEICLISTFVDGELKRIYEYSSKIKEINLCQKNK